VAGHMQVAGTSDDVYDAIQRNHGGPSPVTSPIINMAESRDEIATAADDAAIL